jgi:hypothetical protein
VHKYLELHMKVMAITDSYISLKSTRKWIDCVVNHRHVHSIAYAWPTHVKTD